MPDFNNFDPHKFDAAAFLHKLTDVSLSYLTYAIWWQSHITGEDEEAMTGIHLLTATLNNGSPLSPERLVTLFDHIWDDLIYFTLEHWPNDCPTAVLTLNTVSGFLTKIGDVYTNDDLAHMNPPTTAFPITRHYPSHHGGADIVTIWLSYITSPR